MELVVAAVGGTMLRRHPLAAARQKQCPSDPWPKEDDPCRGAESKKPRSEPAAMTPDEVLLQHLFGSWTSHVVYMW